MIAERIEAIAAILGRIPADSGGGSTPAKCFIMSYVAEKYSLQTYVEIGVYRGRSFFPMADVMKTTGGTAYGIDPYDPELARESDVSPEMKKMIDGIIDALDFEQIYRDVTGLRQSLGLADHVVLLRKPSREGVEDLRAQEVGIGMLHIDGNHDTAAVTGDVKAYAPLLCAGGFVVMDDTDWDSVLPACALLDETMTLVHDAGTFRIYRNEKLPDESAAPLRYELSAVSELFAVTQAAAAAADSAPRQKKKPLLRRLFNG